jgi:hypothetical protein
MISFGGHYGRDAYTDIWSYLQSPVAFVTRARDTQSRILPSDAPRKMPSGGPAEVVGAAETVLQGRRG